MRIFIALDIDREIRERIARFMEGVRGFAPDVRWVTAESLHVTLKFIGEKAPDVVDQVKGALAHVKTAPFEVSFRGYGFFPGARAARVFWVGIEAGPPLAGLAGVVDAAIAQLGIQKEEPEFTPHLTLARAGSGAPRFKRSDAPNLKFKLLQDKLANLSAPEFGTMTAREFFLYESKLSPKGAHYTKLAKFPLE
jgi:RNA 2',3'-cyclic 3'-phosphodiesterase